VRALFTAISGPSGVGKTTIGRAVLEDVALVGAAQTVSSTTKTPRPEEIGGQHYHFLSRESFAEQIARGDFAEWAEYGGNLYGTDRHMLEELLARKRLVMIIPNLEGCRQLRSRGYNPLVFPIIPDDMRVLEERIRARGGIDEDGIRARLEEAAREIEIIESGEFGPPIVNRFNCIDETTELVRDRLIDALFRH